MYSGITRYVHVDVRHSSRNVYAGALRCELVCLCIDYEASGFLALQLAIDRAIIAHHHSNNANSNASSTASVRSNPADVAADSGASGGEFSLRLQRHPYPPYDRDRLVVVLGRYLGYYVLLSLLVIAPCVVKDVVVEKENKLKVRGRGQQAVGGASSKTS